CPCTESCTPWILIPVSRCAATASSRLMWAGLSNSTPWKPRDLISSNFSLIEPWVWIMPNLTAFLSFRPAAAVVGPAKPRAAMASVIGAARAVYRNRRRDGIKSSSPILYQTASLALPRPQAVQRREDRPADVRQVPVRPREAAQDAERRQDPLFQRRRRRQSIGAEQQHR